MSNGPDWRLKLRVLLTKYGMTLSVDEVKRRLAEKAGPGKPVYKEGQWRWMTNIYVGEGH